jgi:broad specificity phosphatase PhoE
MTRPLNFTLVRHGLSEANRMQKFMRSNDVKTLAGLIDPSFISRHDSAARLAKLGVEQAESTGEWLRNNLEPFDRFYVSPHVRTRETAAHLHLNGEWIVDDRFRERDWGEVSSPDENFKDRMSPLSRRLKSLNEWYWKPQGGESLATGVRARFELAMASLYRRENTNNVIAVTHGELIRVAQFVLERMSPDKFNLMDENPEFKVHNTMVLEYTRQNPFNPEEVKDNFHWRRATCPWDESLSWNNGEWVEFFTEKHTDADLLNFAETFGRLFKDEG